MKRIPKTISLFLTFMKIGLFAFGGIVINKPSKIKHKKELTPHG